MRNRLKVLRAQTGWTQAELAQRLGVTRQTVNVIENGKYDPSLPLAFKIAAVFGRPVEEIFLPDAQEPLARRDGSRL
jgi:putative transcriptional regulator